MATGAGTSGAQAGPASRCCVRVILAVPRRACQIQAKSGAQQLQSDQPQSNMRQANATSSAGEGCAADSAPLGSRGPGRTAFGLHGPRPWRQPLLRAETQIPTFQRGARFLLHACDLVVPTLAFRNEMPAASPATNGARRRPDDGSLRDRGWARRRTLLRATGLPKMPSIPSQSNMGGPAGFRPGTPGPSPAGSRADAPSGAAARRPGARSAVRRRLGGGGLGGGVLVVLVGRVGFVGHVAGGLSATRQDHRCAQGQESERCEEQAGKAEGVRLGLRHRSCKKAGGTAQRRPRCTWGGNGVAEAFTALEPECPPTAVAPRIIGV